MPRPALLLAFAALVGSVACGSSVSLPPVEPEQVDVFLPGSLPTEDYKVMSRLSVRRPVQQSDQILIDEARAQAARVGADALVVTAIRLTSEGQVEMDLGREQEKILDALAVYYPSRHPELQDQ